MDTPEPKKSNATDENSSITNQIIKPQSNIIPQLLATTIVSWLSFIVGYSAGYSSPAESTMVQELNITQSQATWIFSFLPVGALIGSVSGGPFVEYLGRKNTLICADVIFLIAWTTNYLSQSYWTMYCSRFLNGYSVGITSLALPVYLAETLKSSIRGRLGLFPTILGDFGIMMSFIFGNFFNWRGLALAGALFTIPFFVLVCFIPETPRWYISKRRLTAARLSLQWFRGTKSDITKEFNELQKHQNVNKSSPLTRSNFKALFIISSLMFFQQFSGINALIFYSTQIFQQSQSTMSSEINSAIVGFVNFVSTFIAAALVDKLGRKILLYISSALMAFTLAVLGGYFFLIDLESGFVDEFHWIPLWSFMLYVLAFSVGFGPIPWLMMAEVLPQRIRGPAGSIATAFNWCCTFVITKTFPLCVDLVGAHNVFWFFGAITICSLLFLWLYVPETKKRTLEDIERILGA